ncbi:MAG: ABC transporter permease subunit, partial [Oscillospiraceae bacterium]
MKKFKSKNDSNGVCIQAYKEPLSKDLKRNASLYIMAIPVILYYLIFMYKPMYGLCIAFKDFTPTKGIIGSTWVGFKHFISFFGNPYFGRLMTNTIVMSLSTLVFSFPIPIILAIMMNELKSKKFSQISQLAIYMPHFISLIVICGLITKFTSSTGLINDMVVFFGGDRMNLLNEPKAFVPIYVISHIWQEAGWGSIIYLAALTGIDQQQYEAATIDGAGRWKQTLHVTIPGILPTIVIMLLLSVGNVLSIGYEKIILLYNPLTYETADVIS